MVSKCVIRQVDYSTDQLMDKTVEEFINQDFKTAVQIVLDKAKESEETANFQFPLMTKAGDGEEVEVLLNATTRRDKDGNIIGVIGIGQDITARLAQEREYSKLIDTANAVCLKIATEGNAVRSANAVKSFVSLLSLVSLFVRSPSLGLTRKAALMFGINVPCLLWGILLTRSLERILSKISFQWNTVLPCSLF
jgi:PAS domain S-box-containing protein